MSRKPVLPLHDFQAQYDAIRTDVALAIADVLQRQDFVLGREVRQLEEEIARLCGVRCAVACASGSDALLLALMALDIRAGDEVLVPSFTFFATAGAVARLGARPLFVDIEPRSFNISVNALERAVTRRRQVRAAIPVDLFGQIAEMEALRACLPEGLPIIEDAAQAILAERGGRRAGSLGRVGTFSFFPAKNLGAYGDGGMLVTDDETLAERARLLRVHGSRAPAGAGATEKAPAGAGATEKAPAGAGATEKDRYYHDEVGINSRLDTLQAAVLLVKLRRLEAWTAARQCAAERYTRLFTERGLTREDAVYPSEESPVVAPRAEPGPGHRHVFHQYTIRALDRDRLHLALDREGIQTAIYYPLPLHLQRCFAALGGKEGDCPEAERAAREVLSLPMVAEITEEQQQRVVAAIAAFFRR